MIGPGRGRKDHIPVIRLYRLSHLEMIGPGRGRKEHCTLWRIAHRISI